MRRTRRFGGARAAVAAAAVALVLAACASGRAPPPSSVGSGPRPGAPEADGLAYSRPPAFARAAQANAQGLSTLPVAPFGRVEAGWEVYMPMVAVEIGAAPVPEGVAFAQALARWQAAHGLPANGVMTEATLARLRDVLQARRPFLQARAASKASSGGAAAPCPDPPDEATLAWTTPQESWGARPNRVRPGALAAWRRMRAAAVREHAVESPLSLQMFSGYRSPTYDAARCASEGTCDNVRRATCSAHRTGLAMDVVLDGVRPVDSTAAADRLRLSRSPTYRWMLANARRFGFVNYPFEPWHWEWTGEPVASPRPAQAEDLLPPGLPR